MTQGNSYDLDYSIILRQLLPLLGEPNSGHMSIFTDKLEKLLGLGF
jgi:hypothetical protein